MYLLFWASQSWAAPEGQASVEHYLFYNTQTPIGQPSVFRGHIGLEDGPFKSDVWLEVFGSAEQNNRGQWLVRPQKLTWERERLSIGYQKHRWGNLDALSAVDLLAPKDMRWGPLIPVEMARIANPSISTRLQYLKWRFDGSIHIGPSLNALSLSETPFSLFPVEGQDSIWSYFSDFSADPLGESLWPSVFDTVENTLLTAPFSLTPAASSNFPVDFSIRSDWSTINRSFGFGLAWLRSRSPAIELAPPLQSILQNQTLPNVLSIQDELEQIDSPFQLLQPHHGHFGLWYSQLIGGFGVRTESSFQTNIPYQTTAFTWQTAHQFQGAIGIDRVISTNIVISSEHRYRSYIATKPDDSFWLTAPQNIESALNVDLLAFQQRLRVQGATLTNWTFKELAIKGVVSWRIGSHYKVNLGVLNMIGISPEDYLDRIGYRGGEIGYFSDNDCVFIQMDWVY